jgi:hypothetical protein
MENYIIAMSSKAALVERTIKQFNEKSTKNNRKRCLCGPHTLMGCKVAYKEGLQTHFRLFNNILGQFADIINQPQFMDNFSDKYETEMTQYISHQLSTSYKSVLRLLICIHQRQIPEHIRFLIVNGIITSENELNLDNIDNMTKIMAYYYCHYIVYNMNETNPGEEDEPYYEYTYYRMTNPFKIQVGNEERSSNALSFLCTDCHKNVEYSKQIRLNCNHLVCINCINKDLCKYNTVDQDNCIEYPTCTECDKTVTHIFVTTRKYKDIYTSLEYGIKPWFLHNDTSLKN